MAITHADLDALDRALASGERMVVLNGQSVTYRSIDDLIKARDYLAARLSELTLSVRRPKRTYAYQSGRGFDE